MPTKCYRWGRQDGLGRVSARPHQRRSVRQIGLVASSHLRHLSVSVFTSTASCTSLDHRASPLTDDQLLPSIPPAPLSEAGGERESASALVRIFVHHLSRPSLVPPGSYREPSSRNGCPIRRVAVNTVRRRRFGTVGQSERSTKPFKYTPGQSSDSTVTLALIELPSGSSGPAEHVPASSPALLLGPSHVDRPLLPLS